MRSRKNHNQ